MLEGSESINQQFMILYMSISLRYLIRSRIGLSFKTRLMYKEVRDHDSSTTSQK